MNDLFTHLQNVVPGWKTLHFLGDINDERDDHYIGESINQILVLLDNTYTYTGIMNSRGDNINTYLGDMCFTLTRNKVAQWAEEFEQPSDDDDDDFV